MTYDPNRMPGRSDHVVVGYGADRHSSGFYAALSVGVLAALVTIFYLIGHAGGWRTVNANNPIGMSATTGQATTETPGLLPTAPRQ